MRRTISFEAKPFDSKDLECEDPMYWATKAQRGADAHSRRPGAPRECLPCRRGPTLRASCFPADGATEMHLGKPLTQESSWSQLLDTKSKLPSLSKDTMGLRIDSVIDSVHAAELGTTAHVLGNICQLCVNARVFGATVDADIKNLAIDLDGRCARRRRIVLTTTSRKTTFAPGPTGHNCTPKMLFGDAWSRTLWDWRGNILDPEKNWFAKCWCLCWLLKDNSSRPRPELRWRRWVFASANPTQSSRRQQRRRDRSSGN